MFVASGSGGASGSFTVGGGANVLREQAELDRIAERVQSFTARLGVAATNLHSVADRTFGMTPPVPENPVENAKPSSALSLIHERLNALNSVVESLESVANRFQNL